MAKKPVDWEKLDARNTKAYQDNKTGNKKAWQQIAASLFDNDDTQLYLTILGLTTIPKTTDELKKARNNKMMTAHPDKGGSHKQALWVNKAYENILKKIERAI